MLENTEKAEKLTDDAANLRQHAEVFSKCDLLFMSVLRDTCEAYVICFHPTPKKLQAVRLPLFAERCNGETSRWQSS